MYLTTTILITCQQCVKKQALYMFYAISHFMQYIILYIHIILYFKNRYIRKAVYFNPLSRSSDCKSSCLFKFLLMRNRLNAKVSLWCNIIPVQCNIRSYLFMFLMKIWKTYEKFLYITLQIKINIFWSTKIVYEGIT